ncbi:MAG: ATP-binding protein [Fimbriimonas sp.]|jgi:signal transduction histidine kinase|nr:ATP-binding protein [Fimbriimonas sp.]
MPDLWSLFDFPPLDGDHIEEYLDTILQRVAEWFDAPVASLFVADEKGTIRCRASVGVPVAETAVIEIGKGIAGSALLHGLPMLVEDPSDNPLLANQIKQTRKEISSAMVVPLTTSHERLGVLNLARLDQDCPFDETDLKKANTLARNISLAVANWKHLGDVKEVSRVRRLAEIGQMTAAIAHEIKNPLTGIRSAAQLIVSMPDQAVELAQMVEEEAMKLSELCNQFLDFARPIEPNFGAVDLFVIATKLREIHQHEFLELSVELRIIGDSNPILGDRHQVERVMQNLMLNALQATGSRGTVTIQILPRGFSVSDTGSGMDNETLSKLFQPFFTTKPKGTGLGLSNCQKIISAHGGVIVVDSKVGEGSSFRVQFADNYVEAA